MPGVAKLDPNNTDQQDKADAEFKERRLFIDKNRRYYDGDMHKPLKDEVDNVLLDMCAEIVDQTVSFLLPDMPEFEMDNDSDTSEDEQWLTNFWEANGGATLLSNIVVNGALAGQSYAKVKPASVEADRDHEYPIIVNLDPANAITWWHDDNYKKIRGYELRWNDRKLTPDKSHSMQSISKKREGHRQIVKYVGGKWEIYEYTGSTDGWVLIESETTLWDHPLPPIVSAQHLPKPNSYYGKDELPHRVINDAINAIASDMKAIVHYQADPTTLLFGVPKGGVQETQIGGLFTIDDKDARAQMLEMRSELQASMNLLLALENFFFRRARVVQLGGNLDAFRGVTNLGIRAAYMPMIAKNSTLRRSYSTFIERVSKVALMLANKPWDVPLRIRWGSALPVDDKEELMNLQMEMNMGIMSKRMAATRRKHDYDMVRKEIMREEMEAGVMRGGAPVGVSA